MVFLIICGLIVAFCIAMLVARSKGLKNRKAELQKAGLSEKDIIEAGRYVYGHPDIDNPLNVAILRNGTDLRIYPQTSILREQDVIAVIPASEIEGITVEDASTIEKKVTALRLLAVGVFAFALKKSKKQEVYYLLIKWNDGKFNHETMFEFVGPGAMQKANSTRNSLIKIARKQPVEV